jgi:hypothetical protein
MKYTVILLRPDYIADTFGQDTYMGHVEAGSVEMAQMLARREAYELDIDEEDRCNYAPDTPEDYFVIAVIAGEHMDIKEQR